ncbi:voltage-gated potassium channel [Pelagirhabdus alkalitolerans]|uniref:Voltage-gated potassium channel n=1 Tax=Pelagirhabdus alkalitolerans TaxID=1612202 RepID=A0A1G6INJ1_9BACI|nr:potassium channel protein [Pelagirhabdus alkalitolerans]SDC07336.1 voltage-gated potassium channel [Pelagirhabdus alkalitolerans]
MKNKRKVIILFVMLTFIVLLGTTSYWILLDISLLDSLYMTIITISTVGYGEVVDLTPEAQIFTMILIFLGIGVIGYAASTIVSYFLEGNIRAFWRDKKMNEAIKNLKNHYIVCGAGETGRHVINSLKKEAIDFVIIECDQTRVEALKEEKLLVLKGDATDESILQEANIESAKGLVTTLSTDANNLYTVLTAREINRQLLIIARAITDTSHEKLIRAGADKTVSPNEIGGHRMASMLLKPSVMAFLDTITHSGSLNLNLNEITVSAESSLCGEMIKDVEIFKSSEGMLIAIKSKGTDDISFNPADNYIIRPQDVLIFLGEEEDLLALNEKVN